MRKMLGAAAFVAALPLVAPTSGAQMPGPGAGPGHGPAVTFLLSHTGQLQLTDQQVVKLAAIARRAADRHKAMRASFDSLRTQFHRGDSGMRHRGGLPPQLRAAIEKERDANHADLRDALAVLTPDQQASAWEIVSEHHFILMRHRGRGMDHMGPRRDGPVMRMRTGMIPGDGPDDDYQVAVDDDE